MPKKTNRRDENRALATTSMCPERRRRAVEN